MSEVAIWEEDSKGGSVHMIKCSYMTKKICKLKPVCGALTHNGVRGMKWSLNSVYLPITFLEVRDSFVH